MPARRPPLRSLDQDENVPNRKRACTTKSVTYEERPLSDEEEMGKDESDDEYVGKDESDDEYEPEF
jgi:hypothetical protein